MYDMLTISPSLIYSKDTVVDVVHQRVDFRSATKPAIPRFMALSISQCLVNVCNKAELL